MGNSQVDQEFSKWQAYSGVPNNRVDVLVFPVLKMHARLDYLERLGYLQVEKKVGNSINKTDLLIYQFYKKSPTLLLGTQLDC